MLLNVVSVLDQRRRLWAIIDPTLGERLVFVGLCLNSLSRVAVATHTLYN